MPCEVLRALMGVWPQCTNTFDSCYLLVVAMRTSFSLTIKSMLNMAAVAVPKFRAIVVAGGVGKNKKFGKSGRSIDESGIILRGMRDVLMPSKSGTLQIWCWRELLHGPLRMLLGHPQSIPVIWSRFKPFDKGIKTPYEVPRALTGVWPQCTNTFHSPCCAPLFEECLQYHGHKGDPKVMLGTCGAIGERAQVILVWVRAPGHWKRLPSTETRSHKG